MAHDYDAEMALWRERAHTARTWGNPAYLLQMLPHAVEPSRVEPVGELLPAYEEESQKSAAR